MLVELSAGGDVSDIGGKGAALAALMRAGAPVPPAWCVPAGVLHDELVQAGLAALAEQVEVDLATGDWRAPARRLRAAILEADLPAKLASRVDTLLRELQARPGPSDLAVRSSATFEGLPGASFAGQFQTFLGVQDLEQAGAAIRSCWASLWSPAALGYRAARPPGPAPGMAVLLQEFLPARAAGSARVDEARVEVEAAYGLGATVMSGLVVPDRFAFGPDGHLQRAEPGRKPVRAAAEAGNLVWQRLSAEQQTTLSIDAETAAGVGRLAGEAAACLGTPLEVEWLLAEDGRLWLLQGRRAERRPSGGVGTSGSPRAGELRGIPAAPGEVVGPVRIVHDLEEIETVRDEEIVVTRYASPALASRPHGAGLITEMGGASAHAAVIARERRIPMITGVLRVTQLLQPGQVVKLDGSAGLVMVLP